MKRFIAFCGMEYYPNGGWEDFLSSHDTVDGAKCALLDFATEGNIMGWWHIVDTETGEIVATSKGAKS